MGNQTPWSESVASLVRQAVKESSLTEHKIATLARIPKSTFGRRLDGVNPWTTIEIEAVAQVLDIDPSDLVPQPGTWEVEAKAS